MSAFFGIQRDIGNWMGHLCLPPGQDPYGSDIIYAHAESQRAEALITLLDAWAVDAGQVRAIREQLGVPVFAWLPVDTLSLSERDEAWLKNSGAYPVAMSRHGERQLKARGFDCSYVPHGVELETFRPPEDREALREQFNLKGRFTVLMCSANQDGIRKSYGESLEAFRLFRERCPEANPLLLLHTWRACPTGINLARMAERKSVIEATSFSDQYAYTIGTISREMLRDLLSSADVLLMPSYGEGFGLPAIEAQAVGTPVILNDASAMSELCGSGWLTPGQPWWNEAHGASWKVPYIDYQCPECGHREGIAAALEAAWEASKDGSIEPMRQKARTFAEQYDADLITEKYWRPTLDLLESMTKAGKQARLPDADRDAAVERLSVAYAAGLLDADTFGDRAGKVLAAETRDELAVLTADLPEHQEAA